MPPYKKMTQIVYLIARSAVHLTIPLIKETFQDSASKCLKTRFKCQLEELNWTVLYMIEIDLSDGCEQS